MPRAALTPRYLALGDSYTIGEGVDPADRFPTRLSARIDIDPPVVVARTGWTADELGAALDEKAPTGPFDLVTLLVGVNDQYRGYGVDRFAGALGRVLAKARDLAKPGGGLIVLSIPDWGVTPFANGRDRHAVSREIDAFNDVVRAAAQSAGAPCLDVTPSSRKAETDSALLAADGLHPSAAMYSIWVDLLEPMARRALGI